MIGAGSSSRVVAAGALAQRMVLADQPSWEARVLEVPHPSFNGWHRVGVPLALDDARRHFTSSSAPS